MKEALETILTTQELECRAEYLADILLFKRCYLKCFENLEGRILAISICKYGLEIKVSYCLNGEYRTEWFDSFNIALKKEEL